MIYDSQTGKFSGEGDIKRKNKTKIVKSVTNIITILVSLVVRFVFVFVIFNKNLIYNSQRNVLI